MLRHAYDNDRKVILPLTFEEGQHCILEAR